MQLGADLDDGAQALGREHARLALETRRSRASARRFFRAARRASCWVTGGVELRGGDWPGAGVDVEGGGRGGRNTEYLAALALELDGAPGIAVLAADTDGIDGHGDHAGGVVVPAISPLGAARGLSLADYCATRHLQLP